MKVNIKELKEVFSPITISITLESEEEFINLWHRFNINASSLKNDYRKTFEINEYDNLNRSELSTQIDKVRNKRQINISGGS